MKWVLGTIAMLVLVGLCYLFHWWPFSQKPISQIVTNTRHDSLPAAKPLLARLPDIRFVCPLATDAKWCSYDTTIVKADSTGKPFLTNKLGSTRICFDSMPSRAFSVTWNDSIKVVVSGNDPDDEKCTPIAVERRVRRPAL